jgi:hypothetical protein
MELFKYTRRVMTFATAAAVALTGFSATEEEHDALIALAKDKESDFAVGLLTAVDDGMSADWVLEAEIIRGLSTGNADAMFDLISRIDGVGDDFRFGVGRDFYSIEQLEGFSDVLLCVVAYRSNDFEAFEIIHSGLHPAKIFSQSRVPLIGQRRIAVQQILRRRLAVRRLRQPAELPSMNGHLLHWRSRRWLNRGSALAKHARRSEIARRCVL